MKKLWFRILLVSTTSIVCAGALACGDLEGGEGNACLPDEPAPDGFECVCDDREDFDTCSLEAVDDTNNGAANNNGVDDDNNGGISNTRTVTAFDAAYDPQSLTISRGTTITFRNDEPGTIQRNWYAPEAGPGDGLDITLNPGESEQYTFDVAGTFDVSDRINTNLPGLRMTITVQ